MAMNKVLGIKTGSPQNVDTPPPQKGEGYYDEVMQKEVDKEHKSELGSNSKITENLKGIGKDMEQSGTSEEGIIQTSYGRKVIRSGLPVFDLREHDDVGMLENLEMKNRYPGGDVMHQLMWAKWKGVGTMSPTVPPEEDWYAGARLGEYARPLIMGPERVGYLNQAPVPMSPSEDLLTLVSEAGVGSRRATNAAVYAKQSAGQAMEFFRLAQRRARQIFHDPPVSVRPGGDVWPFYSASSPVLLAPPPRCRRSRSAGLYSRSSTKVSRGCQRQKRRKHVLRSCSQASRCALAEFL